MKYLTSSLKAFLNRPIPMKLRNLFNIYPRSTYLPYGIDSYSISDAFFWRTDNNASTIFRFSNIPEQFFDCKNVSVDFIFLSKDGKCIKTYPVKDINSSNELLINSDFLDGVKSYGTFSIFYNLENQTTSDIKINNRCYVGFKPYNLSIPSFVHGNFHAQYRHFGSNKKIYKDIIQTSFRTSKYIIQKDFSKTTKTELLFHNPTSKKIKLKVNNHVHFLKPSQSKIILSDDSIIEVKSNLMIPRPVVYATYKNGFIDCCHA